MENPKLTTLEKNSKTKGFLEEEWFTDKTVIGFSPSCSPLGSVIKMVFGAWEVSVMIASSIFAVVSLTMHPQWHDMLSGKQNIYHEW